MSNQLNHYGVKGMKWGVRRYQRSDGTLTTAGKKRYRDTDHETSTLDTLSNRMHKKYGDKTINIDKSFTKNLNVKNPVVKAGMMFVENLLRSSESQVPKHENPWTEKPNRDKDSGNI